MWRSVGLTSSDEHSGFPVSSGVLEALEISFQYDFDGILHVNAVIKSTGRSAGIRIDTAKMTAVGPTRLAVARRSIDTLWESSRSARRLRDIVAEVEHRVSNSERSEEAIRIRIDAARDALERGDADAIRKYSRELSVWLGMKDS